MNGELKPTAKLRFVERSVVGEVHEGGTNVRVVRILQQWWAPDVPAYMVDPSQGEWRDVPLESAP